MYGFPLVIILVFIGGLIAYLGDRIGMKVGKNRLSLFGLRPKYSSIIITIITGVLIAVFSLGVMLTASEKARIAVFRLDQILVEIDSTKEELATLREEKRELTAQVDNLAHNLKLFGEKYFFYLKEDIIYKKGVEVSKIAITSSSKNKIRNKLAEWLIEINDQAQELQLAELKYNKLALERLITILSSTEEESLVRLITANNIFVGDNLVIDFNLVGDQF